MAILFGEVIVAPPVNVPLPESVKLVRPVPKLYTSAVLKVVDLVITSVTAPVVPLKLDVTAGTAASVILKTSAPDPVPTIDVAGSTKGVLVEPPTVTVPVPVLEIVMLVCVAAFVVVPVKVNEPEPLSLKLNMPVAPVPVSLSVVIVKLPDDVLLNCKPWPLFAAVARVKLVNVTGCESVLANTPVAANGVVPPSVIADTVIGPEPLKFAVVKPAPVFVIPLAVSVLLEVFCKVIVAKLVSVKDPNVGVPALAKKLIDDDDVAFELLVKLTVVAALELSLIVRVDALLAAETVKGPVPATTIEAKDEPAVLLFE